MAPPAVGALRPGVEDPVPLRDHPDEVLDPGPHRVSVERVGLPAGGPHPEDVAVRVVDLGVVRQDEGPVALHLVAVEAVDAPELPVDVTGLPARPDDRQDVYVAGQLDDVVVRDLHVGLQLDLRLGLRVPLRDLAP